MIVTELDPPYCHLPYICHVIVTSDKLEAFEMWLYRRMLRISWKEHKTNADVLHKMKTKRSLLNTIKKRKCQYFGHILNLMENRKQFKNSDKDEYNRLNKQINLACKEAKEKWLVNEREEVEQLEKQCGSGGGCTTK